VEAAAQETSNTPNRSSTADPVSQMSEFGIIKELMAETTAQSENMKSLRLQEGNRLDVRGTEWLPLWKCG